MKRNPIGLALGGMVALAVVMGFGRFAYTPILPVMMADLGLSTTMAGIIASANFAGYLAGAMAASAPRRKGTPWDNLFYGLILCTLTTLVLFWVKNPTQLVVLRFVTGFASAFGLIYASGLVIDRLAQSGRPELAPLAFSGVGVGMAVSAVLISLMIAEQHNSHSLWLACGLVMLAGSMAVWALIPRRGPPSQTAEAPHPADPKLFRAYALSYGICGFGYVITATFLVAMVRNAPETRVIEPYIWLIVGLANAPPGFLWEWVARRTGYANAFALACLTLASGVVCAGLWASVPGAILGAIMLGGTIMGVTSLGFQGARRVSPHDSSRAVGQMTVAFGTGQMIGPTVGAILAERSGGFALPSLLAGLLLVFAAWLVWWVARSRHRRAYG